MAFFVQKNERHWHRSWKVIYWLVIIGESQILFNIRDFLGVEKWS